jgi:hypothetical protein
MKKSHIYISMIMLLGGCFSVIAQEPTLTKEITVETDFVPVEQKATKLNKLPDVTKTTIPTKKLNYSNWSGTVDFPTAINILEPYGYKTKYSFSKAKGYLDLGVGTQMNVVGSAGYKFIDTNERQLNAWLQHNSTWMGKNTAPLASTNPLKQKYNDNVLAVNFANKFEVGLLNLSAYFHLDNFNYYGVNDFSYFDKTDQQTATEFGLKAGWTRPVTGENELQFAAQLAFNHFGYSKNLNNEKNGILCSTFLGKPGIQVRDEVAYTKLTDTMKCREIFKEWKMGLHSDAMNCPEIIMKETMEFFEKTAIPNGITLYISQSGTVACTGYALGVVDYKADSEDWVDFLDGYILRL